MISMQKKRNLVSSYEKRFRILNDREFKDTKHNPKIVVSLGENSYTDNSVIVLGLGGQYTEWCNTEAELFTTMSYVRGHESQHVLSTTQKAWNYALKRGCEVVIEALLKKYGIHTRLSNDRDYITALSELSKKGVYISMDELMTLVHYIANSLEDGRIEIIRSVEKVDFKLQVVLVRRKTWSLVGIPKTMIMPVENMSADLKLRHILNQVLSLATSSLYQKGFIENFHDTELDEAVKKVIPYIAKAVTAKRCRTMADNAIKICEILADLIGEAAKIPEFKDQIVWIKGSISDFDFAKRETDENEEKEGSEGNNEIPFSNSDLYIELPDDEYDELMKKLKENPEEEKGENGGTIHVRREHPLPPEEKEKENKKEEGSGSQNSKKDSENNNSGSTSKEESLTSNEKPGELERNSEESTKSSSKSTQESSDGETNAAGGDTDEGKANSSEPQKNALQKKESSDSVGAQGGQMSNDPSQDTDDIEKSVMEEMEKAAEEAIGMAEDTIDNLDNVVKKQEKAQSLDEDVEEEVKQTPQSVVDDVNSKLGMDLKLLELQRKYKVDTLLPPELMREIDTLSKKLEQYLKDKKVKYRRQLKSGKLDSSRLAMLAANEITVFKEQKKSKGVKACAELIVDNSGSMGYGRGSKREFACTALAKIEMIFGKYFPLKIFAFDANGSAVIHEVIKGWNEHFSRSGAWNFLEKGRYGSSNIDAYSIRVATEDILTRPEKKKLLVILSDGAPCYCSEDDVRDAVRDARKQGILVVSIFFASSNRDLERYAPIFEKMYEKDYILCSPEKIGENLLKILKKFFF